MDKGAVDGTAAADDEVVDAVDKGAVDGITAVDDEVANVVDEGAVDGITAEDDVYVLPPPTSAAPTPASAASLPANTTLSLPSLDSPETALLPGQRPGSAHQRAHGAGPCAPAQCPELPVASQPAQGLWQGPARGSPAPLPVDLPPLR